MPETTGYAEIAEDLRRQIQDGTLQPGDTMPSFKKLVAQYGVAITTVNRAYRLLKREGLTVAKPGVGTVVASPDNRNGGTPRIAQMNRDRIALIEQQTEEPHTELGDCIKLVAASAWDAAWRQARKDQAPDPALSAQIDYLIEHDDFLTVALYRHNWRNVNAVLAAFRDAGLAGSSDVAAFYTHVNRIPETGAPR